jgi:hypothetical protein
LALRLGIISYTWVNEFEIYLFPGDKIIVSTERMCQATALIEVKRSFEKTKKAGDTQKT